jgi:TPR repeat protein
MMMHLKISKRLYYRDELISKEDFAAALRGHQAAVDDATKSSQRDEADFDVNHMKRLEANDPEAICTMGFKRFEEGDYKGAFQYFSKAAGLGNIRAHHNLSCLYREGQGVERDEKKQMQHLEQAAICGHPDARHNLGVGEWNNGRRERAYYRRQPWR